MFGMLWVAQSLRQPCPEGSDVVAGVLMRFDNGLLAGFQSAVEIGGADDVIGCELDGAKRLLQFRHQISQHDSGAAGCRRFLDLQEAVSGRRIDARHQAEVENQEAALGMSFEQRLDMLIKPICRSEK